jgi:hypothetical protein
VTEVGVWVPVVRGLVYDGSAWRRFWPETEATSTTITSGLTGTIPVATSRAIGGSVVSASTLTGGTVTVYQRAVGATAWTQIGVSATLGSGTTRAWTATCTPTICGPSEFKAVFAGGGAQGSESAVTAATVSVGTVGALTGGAITNTSLALSWTAVPGATSYQVLRNGAVVGNPTAANFTDTGLATGTTYDYQVRAMATPCTGALSPMKQGRTSQDAVTDTGSQSVTIDASVTGNWRSDGWGSYTTADVYQGFATDPTRNYTGIVDYGGAARVKSIVEAALGVNGVQRFANATVTLAEVYLYRVPAGSGSGVPVGFYTSDSQCNVGGQPGRKGTLVTVTSTAINAGKWYAIGVEHGTALVKGTSRSLATYNNSADNYAKFVSKSFNADSCDLRVTLSWSYQLSTAVAGAWLN